MGADLFFAQQGDSAQVIFTLKGGIGIGGYHLTYGRNFLGKSPSIEGLGKNVFTLTTSLSIFKKDHLKRTKPKQ